MKPFKEQVGKIYLMNTGGTNSQEQFITRNIGKFY